MKKIVCEMCESTEFVKEDGLFVCQDCGCKYTPEDAKTMMKEIAETPVVSTPEPVIEEVHEEKTIPLHAPDSPNKLSVTLVKLGHKDFHLPFFQPYFAEGPHPVSKTIGAEILVKNLAGKTIKYVDVYLLPLNAMGEQMYGLSTIKKQMRIVTAPLKQAAALHQIPADPAVGIRLPTRENVKKDERAVEAYLPEEQEALFAFCPAVTPTQLKGVL